MSDLNTPTWLQETEAEAPSSSGPVSVPPPPAPAASNTSSTRAPMTEAEVTADDPDLPGVILTMRLANMGAAVFLVVVAVGFRVQR